MNSATLAGAARNAIILRMSETPIVHIIDDDESMCVALDSLLRSVGLQTRTYASVDAFLAAPRRTRPVA